MSSRESSGKSAPAMPSIVLVCICSTGDHETNAQSCSVSLWRQGRGEQEWGWGEVGWGWAGKASRKVLGLLEMGRAAQGELSWASPGHLEPSAHKHLLGKQLGALVIAKWIFSCLGHLGSVI